MKKVWLLALLLGFPRTSVAEPYSLAGHWEGAVVRLGAVQPIAVGDLRTGTWSWPEGYWVWAKRAPGYAETVMGWLRRRCAASDGKDGK